MRLKTFQAKSMSEAMRLIKDALGEDAIIVSSRDEPGGGVRVTAAIEQVNPEPEKPAAILSREIPQTDAGGPEDPDLIAERVTDTLLRHRVPASVTDKLLTAIMVQPPSDTRTALSRALAKIFGFRDLTPIGRASPTPLMLVGPPGAGKTLMSAKLAARHVMDGHKPVVITTDTARAGGVEQLKAFLDIMGLPLLVAPTAADLRAHLAGRDPAAQVIIDTGGLNPFDAQEMKDLARIMAAQKTETALVLPAGMDAEESAEIAMTFEILGVTRLIPTRLDFARRLGGVLSAAERAALSFSVDSHTAQVANGILPLTAEHLADLLLPAGRTSSAETPIAPSRKGSA
jgi:flagellar biosynthesis protein FlhF